MDKSISEKVKSSIQNLKDKKSRIYLVVQDTKGQARASVRFIYQMAKALKINGFNPIILHEKNDYTGVGKWLGEGYMKELPHQSIEQQNLEIAPEDFIVIPEIFGFIMDQIKNLPCGKIVLAQSYSYILETLNPGQSWSQLGFFKCITTTEQQKNYIESVMRQVSTDIITPTISSFFEPKKTPPMPIIGIHTKDQRDTINIIKTFYLKFPQYRWFTFRDLRGLTEVEFAETLKDCFLSVWVDDDSAFGTFPLESMGCGVPVLGKIPNLQQEWMTEENGLWVNEKILMPDFIADFIQNWLEDNINTAIYDEMKKASDKYKDITNFNNTVVSLFEGYLNTRSESLEAQISKIEE